PLRQEEIKRSGHAIECRLYAEDPVTYFPSPGDITKLTLPENIARYDFGILEGTKVTPFYHPMIGKIIDHDETREAAIRKMVEVLDGNEVEGITTNLTLLQRVMRADQVTTGNNTTNLLEEINT